MTIERAFATASFTLDATVDTLVGGMTLSPAAGKHLAVFNCEILTPAGPTAGHILTFSIYVNGVQIAASERDYGEDTSITDTPLPMIVTAEVNPTAGQAVEVRYRSNFAATPMSAEIREFNLFPIAGTAFEDSATGDDTLNNAMFTTLDSMTRTPPADDYLMVFSCSAEGPADVGLQFQLTVGGTEVAASRITYFSESSIDNRSSPVLVIASISPDGAEVVEIEWRRSVGMGTITAHERTMQLIVMPTVDLFEATGTADDTDVTTVDKQIDDMLITDPGVNDYLTLFASSTLYGNIGSPTKITTYSVRVAGTKVADSARDHGHEPSLDDTDLPVMTAAKVTTSLSTDDLQMFWQGNQTDLRTMHERTFIAIRETALDQIIVMDELSVASSAEDATPVGGPVTVAMGEISLASSPEAMTPIPGPVFIGMAELGLASSPETLTPIGGPVIITMAEIILASSPEKVGVVPGGIAIGMQELLMSASAETFNLAADRFIDMDSLTLVGSAEALTPIGGPVTISLDELGLASSAEFMIPSKVVIMGETTVASSPEALAVVPGPIEIPMNELGISAAPQFLNALGGPITVPMNEVTITATPVFLGDVGELAIVKKFVSLKGRFGGISLEGDVT